jgi:two-component system cell cycle sensor histidine kinase/response regulator CckA
MVKPGYIGGVPSTESEPLTQGSRGSTVLIVDDERMVRVAMRHTLEKHGYQVLEAASGREAITLLHQGNGSVDLVVTDIVMPGMNGVEMIKRIAASKIVLPVIYMSGYMLDTAVQKIAGVRNQWMLAKPFFPAMLMSAVQKALAVAGAGDGKGKS